METWVQVSLGGRSFGSLELVKGSYELLIVGVGDLKSFARVDYPLNHEIIF